MSRNLLKSWSRLTYAINACIIVYVVLLTQAEFYDKPWWVIVLALLITICVEVAVRIKHEHQRLLYSVGASLLRAFVFLTIIVVAVISFYYIAIMHAKPFR